MPNTWDPLVRDEQNGSKHSEVRRELERRLSGMLPGEPMPAERDLAQSIGVARMTLRRGLDSFVREGRLLRRQGAGTFVAPHRVDQRLSATSFSQDMQARGMKPGSHTLSSRRTGIDPDTATRLNLDTGHEVLHIRRLRTADGAPMAVEDLHVPGDLVPGLTGADLEDASFYETLRTRFGLQLSQGTQTVEPILIKSADADCLKVSAGDPAFLFERVSRLTDGRVIEFVRSVYPGDRYRIVADIFPDTPQTHTEER